VAVREFLESLEAPAAVLFVARLDDDDDDDAVALSAVIPGLTFRTTLIVTSVSASSMPYADSVCCGLSSTCPRYISI